jgi:hypothetical protein
MCGGSPDCLALSCVVAQHYIKGETNVERRNQYRAGCSRAACPESKRGFSTCLDSIR